MGRKKKLDNKILTDAELKVMNIVWKLKKATVHQVLEKLASEENYAYNTASTIMRILEKKGFLSTMKSGRSHIYSPLLSRDEYELIGVNHMVNELFEGTPIALIRKLLGETSLSKNDVKELRALLTHKESK